MSRKSVSSVLVTALALAAAAFTGCQSQPPPPPPSPPSPAAAVAAPVAQAAHEASVKNSAPEVCRNCGVVTSVQAVEAKGEGTGVGATIGAVVGGVAGGVLGHQIGGGKGKTVATAGGAVGGAAGGALAGNEIEKRARKTTHWVVSVRMDDGDKREFSFETAPAFDPGQKVKVVDGVLVPAR